MTQVIPSETQRCGVQGVDGWDVDLPTMFEANLITNAFMKVAWVFVYLGVYGLRPVIIRPKANSK